MTCLQWPTVMLLRPYGLEVAHGGRAFNILAAREKDYNAHMDRTGRMHGKHLSHHAEEAGALLRFRILPATSLCSVRAIHGTSGRRCGLSSFPWRTRSAMGGSASKSSPSADCPVLDQRNASSCPVPESQRSSAVYNVYNQRIDSGNAASTSRPTGDVDPRNNMPREPNQQPCAGQRQLISTSRLVSNIPKGGTQGTWVYPSPQMFYNALKRKGKGSDVEEADMDAVVHAHNTMNELTWRRVLEWEALHHDTCGDPKLLRFLGKPHDLSPMARLMSWVGGPLPFDRHDWFVDRCGDEVRYVIDFYFDDDKAGTPEAFTLRVRPAVDSPSAALDRVKMNIYTMFAKYGLPCPVTGHSSGQFKQPNAEVRTNS